MRRADRRRQRRRRPPRGAPSRGGQRQHQQPGQGDARADATEAPPRQLRGPPAGMVQHPVDGDDEQDRAGEPGDRPDRQPVRARCASGAWRQADDDGDERQSPRGSRPDQPGATTPASAPAGSPRSWRLRAHPPPPGSDPPARSSSAGWGVDEPADAHGRRQRGCASGDVNVVWCQVIAAIVDNRGATAPRLVCSQLEGVAFNGAPTTAAAAAAVAASEPARTAPAPGAGSRNRAAPRDTRAVAVGPVSG